MVAMTRLGCHGSRRSAHHKIKGLNASWSLVTRSVGVECPDPTGKGRALRHRSMKIKQTSPVYLDDIRQARAILSGDEGAFRSFFEENYARLYRFALPRLDRDHGAAEDVAQQVLAEALDKLDTYRAEAQLFTWLCSICRNRIIDWQRKNNSYRKNVVLIEDSPEIQAVVDSFHAPEQDHPEYDAQRTEVVRLIEVALDRLPPKYGDLLEWKYVEGFSVREIATRMNISNEAVQSLLARAKRAFKEIYWPLAQAAGASPVGANNHD